MSNKMTLVQLFKNTNDNCSKIQIVQKYNRQSFKNTNEIKFTILNVQNRG